jgi:hypothetical protein
MGLAYGFTAFAISWVRAALSVQPLVIELYHPEPVYAFRPRLALPSIALIVRLAAGNPTTFTDASLITLS